MGPLTLGSQIHSRLLHSAVAAPFEKQILQPAAQRGKAYDLTTRTPNPLDHAALFLRRNRYAYRSRVDTGARGSRIYAAKLGKRNTAQLYLHPIGLALKIPERTTTNQAALI